MWGGLGGTGQDPCRSTGQVSNYGLVVESVCHLQRPGSSLQGSLRKVLGPGPHTAQSEAPSVIQAEAGRSYY